MISTKPCTPAADYRTGAPRADGWAPERQATFLIALAESGLVSSACKVAKMSVTSAYMLRRGPRGMAFALGWKAAHLLARDRLEDVLLEAAVDGVESVSARTEGVTRRRALSPGLSMAVLNRLDRVQASLDDSAAAVSRAIGASFDDFIALVLAGGSAPRISAFLKRHADPLAAQVASAARASDPTPAPAPKLPEKSVVFNQAPARNSAASVSFNLRSPAPEPCACPADRVSALLEAV
jgi:hypothetical protein